MALAALAAASALGVYVASASRAAAPAAAPAPHDDAELRDRLERARLEQKLSHLESELAALQPGAEAPPVAPEVPSPADEPSGVAPSEAEMQRRRQQEEARIFAQIGEHFAAQPVDSAWATEMTRRLHEHVRAQPAASFQVANVECRSSACRIELDVRGDADLAEIRDGLRYRLADVMGTGASKRDEAGRFVLYLAKDPQALGI